MRISEFVAPGPVSPLKASGWQPYTREFLVHIPENELYMIYSILRYVADLQEASDKIRELADTMELCFDKTAATARDLIASAAAQSRQPS